MIQRVQTIWLILAAAAGFAMTQIPVFEAVLPTNQIQKVFATDNLLLYAVIVGTSCLSLICLFLFKNRPLQFKLTVLAIILSIIIVALEVYKVEGYKTGNNFTKGTYQLGALLPIVMIVLLIMAARGIFKDEKLVKSLDRLR